LSIRGKRFKKKKRDCDVSCSSTWAYLLWFIFGFTTKHCPRIREPRRESLYSERESKLHAYVAS